MCVRPVYILCVFTRTCRLWNNWSLLLRINHRRVYTHIYNIMIIICIPAQSVIIILLSHIGLVGIINIMRWLRVEVAAAKWETIRIARAHTHTHTPGWCRLEGWYTRGYIWLYRYTTRRLVVVRVSANWFPVWTRLISSGIIIILYCILVFGYPVTIIFYIGARCFWWNTEIWW